MFASFVLVTSIAMLPYVIVAEPIPAPTSPVIADGATNSHGINKEDPDNLCCLPNSNCESCSAFYFCPDEICKHILFTDCCAIQFTAELDDGTVEYYNVGGKKMEFISVTGQEDNEAKTRPPHST